MNIRNSLRLAPLCAALTLIGSGAAHAGVGIRVLAQDWNPARPAEQATRRLVDEPGAVSDALMKGWAVARKRICTELYNKMGLGGAAGGFTLRDIDCVLDATPTFSVAPNGPDGLTALAGFGGYLAVTSTTPDHFDKALDPRFSIRVKANLALKISVQPNPAQTLRVDTAGFTLSDTTLDSHNLSGDILKFVVGDLAKFFTGTDYRHLAEAAVNGVAGDIAKPFNTAFAPINNRLRPPSGLVRVGLWASPDLIAVGYGPQPVMPTTGGSLGGVFRWDGGQTAGRCDGLSIAASVQTGPAPMGPDGRFDRAYAPRKPVGDFRFDGTGPAGECRYRITGLATGWQNDLAPKGRTESSEVTATRNGAKRMRVSLRGDGWDGVKVTPQPAARGDYVIVTAPLVGPVIDPSIAANREAPLVIGPGPKLGDRIAATSPVSATTLPAAPGQAAAVRPVSIAPQARSWGSASAMTATATSTSAFAPSRPPTAATAFRR
ncbi:MAG: hypothetical protein ABI281_10455 [Caldimonas sp.]